MTSLIQRKHEKAYEHIRSPPERTIRGLAEPVRKTTRGGKARRGGKELSERRIDELFQFIKGEQKFNYFYYLWMITQKKKYQYEKKNCRLKIRNQFYDPILVLSVPMNPFPNEFVLFHRFLFLPPCHHLLYIHISHKIFFKHISSSLFLNELGALLSYFFHRLNACPNSYHQSFQKANYKKLRSWDLLSYPKSNCISFLQKDKKQNGKE